MYRRSTPLLTALALLLSAVPVLAQQSDGKAPAAEPFVIRGAETTAPVYPRIGRVDLSRAKSAPAWQPGDPIREVPRRRFGSDSSAQASPRAQGGIDPLAREQRQMAATRGTAVLSEPIQNFDANGFTGALPPDPTGAIGIDHFVQAVNGSGGSSVLVYDRTGTEVGSFSMASIGSGDCANFGSGDPIVVYDQLAHRWLLTEFTSPGKNQLCVYVSTTDSPLGAYYQYTFSIPSFPDYPKYGVWPDGYYVGTNESVSPTVIVLERQAMLRGQAATSQRMTIPALAGFGFQLSIPADFDGRRRPDHNTPAIFGRHNDDESHSGSPDAGGDLIQLFEFSVDWDTPANSAVTGPIDVSISEIDSNLCGLFSFECVPQQGTSQTVDPLREPLMYRLQYRKFDSHETLMANLVTDVDGDDQHGVRWVELRRTSGPWTLYQEGTWSPDALHRWMGSISMDGAGNVALAYNRSSTTSYPGLFYTGRKSDDTGGLMTQGEQAIQAGAGSTLSERYGDYNQMTVDPTDDCTFWVTGEYSGASVWGTKIASFSFLGCSPSDIHAVDFEDAETWEWSKIVAP
jgi:hypothetical protein